LSLFLGRPPPINYSTHPKCSVLTSAAQATTQAALTAPLLDEASTPSLGTHSFPLISQSAAASSVYEHDRSINPLADAFDALSTDEMSHWHVTQSSVASTDSTQLERRRGKYYYSVVVGKCCGVYHSW
jgi:hypothetical protein